MKTIALALSLALLAARAHAADYTYQGSLESKAVSYTGESYDRNFDVVVTFSPKDEALTVAAVEQTSVCRDADEPSIDCVSPADFDAYCETNAALELGAVRVTVTERETGATATRSYPWRARVGRSELKGAAACATANLDGGSVSGEIHADFTLPSVKAGTARSLSVVVEPSVAGESADDLALATTLLAAGNNAYRTAPWTARPAAKAWWSYTHEAYDATTWGTNGFMTLVRK